MKKTTDGFTLIEVLVALAILAVMAYAISAGVMQTLQNETYTNTVSEYHLLMQSLAAKNLTGQEVEDALPAERNPWTLQPVAVRHETFDLFSLSHADRPSMNVKMAFRISKE